MSKKAPLARTLPLLALPLLVACGPTTINVVQPTLPPTKSASPSAAPSASPSTAATVAPSRSAPPTHSPSPAMSTSPSPTSTATATAGAPECTPPTVPPDVAPAGAGAYAGLELPGSWNSLYKDEDAISAAIADVTPYVKCNYPKAYETWLKLTGASAPPTAAPDCTPPTLPPDIAPASAGAYAGLELPGTWNQQYQDEVAISTAIAALWRPGQVSYVQCGYPKAYAAWQKLYGGPCAPETITPEVVPAGPQAGAYAGLSMPADSAKLTEAEISASITSLEGLPYPNNWLCRYQKVYETWEKLGRPDGK